jgi:hypothetical protein
MISEVETVLGNTRLGGLVEFLTLESISLDFEAGEKQMGIATMKFRANYMTVANAPNAVI